MGIKMTDLKDIVERIAQNEKTWIPKKAGKLESGWYDKNLKRIDPDEREIGAILYVTKDFNSLKDFLKKFKKTKRRVQYGMNDFIVDVFNGWMDTTIKVYAKIDYKKRHQDYLRVIKK